MTTAAVAAADGDDYGWDACGIGGEVVVANDPRLLLRLNLLLLDLHILLLSSASITGR